MGGGFSHVALAVFTTLAPMGAGAFLALACAFFTGKLNAEDVKRLDKLSLLPLGVFLVGLVAAFFHLGSPLHAFGVFAGVGASPLSNELVAVVLFALVAVAYCVLALMGKLSEGARKGLLVGACVLALVMLVFSGLAYMMPTIPTWDTPATVVQMLGFGILGGTVLGALTLGLAHVEVKAPAPMALLVLAAVGAVLALVGFAWQLVACGSISNIWGAAIELVPAAWALFALLAACAAAGVACVFVGGKKGFAPVVCGAGFAAVVVGVFFARIAFYGLFMSIAL